MGRSVGALKRLVFWEPCLSRHKLELFEAIASQCPELRVVCCADAGWPSPALAMDPPRNVELLVQPQAATIASLIDGEPDDSLHVFSGLRWVPTIVAALRRARHGTAHCALMSEPRVREGFGGLARWAQSWLGEGWLRRRVDFVLAQGRHGPGWFRSVGYPPDRIFPYAYFVRPLEIGGTVAGPQADGVVRVGFVGRLVRAKGVFELVDAARRLGGGARLSLVGSGDAEPELRARAPDAVFRGALPNAEAVAFMRGLDVLVLPSLTTDDGWGVVVSEALMQGTAVVATTAVGASLILDDRLLGRHVPAGSGDAIARAIIDLRDCGAFDAEQRQARLRRARAMLSADAGASNLLSIIRWSRGRGPRPAAFCDLEEALA